MNKSRVIEAMTIFGSPEDVSCCAQLLEYIETGSKRIYYYSDFIEAVSDLHLHDPIQTVQRSLNLFKSRGFGLLRQEYRYLDDDGVVYPVEVEDLQAAYDDGALYLDWRNGSDSDFADKVYIVFFVGSDGAV